MTSKYKFITGILVANCFILISALSSFAQDTLAVQTLTFDSISARRGYWKFPDNPEQFRKIMMKYTLKCDPRTPWDKYDCGEWDYLTYNEVFTHTGVMDSNKLQAPLYKIGKLALDTFKITSKSYSNTYNRILQIPKITNVLSEKEYKFNPGSQKVTLGHTGRIQFLILKADRDSAGLAGKISRIKIPINSFGANFKAFSVKLKGISAFTKDVKQFDNDVLIDVFNGSILSNSQTEMTVDFLQPFDWTASNNLLVDINYTLDDYNGKVEFSGNSLKNCMVADGFDNFLVFDGNNDWIDCGPMPQLNDAKSFTYEGWVRVDSWKNWTNLIGKGSNVAIQLGDKVGDIYCIIRNPSANTYGSVSNALKLGQWAHLAMVYDGSKSTNAEKLKLYVNGVEKALTYPANTIIPISVPNEPAGFSISEPNNSLVGAMDEVRVWSKPIDAATIPAWMDKSVLTAHPDFAKLISNYPLNTITDYKVLNEKTGNRDGILLGVPSIDSLVGENLTRFVTKQAFVPAISLFQGEYSSLIDTALINVSKKVDPVTLETFEIKDHQPVRKDIRYVWMPGYSYTYDTNNKAIDSVVVAPEETVVNEKLNYYGKPFEIVKSLEIGRFITPYGINLDLGPKGFTWMYDVTDYAPFLKGNVDFSAGNTQELIDVQFLFIKGESPRDVLKINEVWGPMASYSYRDMSDDSVMSKKEVVLNPQTKNIKMITRLTGHGHQSSNGKPPWCCEWKDNTHTLYANDEKVADWRIFLDNDCALNPVYPQGGTWPGSREGWCPGDVVRNYEFELSKYIEDGKVSVDYDITKVPVDNPGMGSGNYVTAMHLVEYGQLKHDFDAEVYDIVSPNEFDYYSRKNPICANPQVIIRNNGKDPLTSLDISYGVSGGKTEVYSWKGNIASQSRETVTIPLPGPEFWIGDANHQFTVSVSKPNGSDDQNSSNNTATSKFNMPDIYKDGVVLVCQANLRSEGYSYFIYDMTGKKVLDRATIEANKLYKDVISLPKGCYTLEFTDVYNMGLSYWAYPDQGSGYLRIEDASGKVLKTFNPDFGHGITYSFDMGNFTSIADQESGLEYEINVFPNPTSDMLTVNTGDMKGSTDIQVFDILGKMLMSRNVDSEANTSINLDIKNLGAGVYNITLINGNKKVYRKFLKR